MRVRPKKPQHGDAEKHRCYLCMAVCDKRPSNWKHSEHTVQSTPPHPPQRLPHAPPPTLLHTHQQHPGRRPCLQGQHPAGRPAGRPSSCHQHQEPLAARQVLLLLLQGPAAAASRPLHQQHQQGRRADRLAPWAPSCPSCLPWEEEEEEEEEMGGSNHKQAQQHTQQNITLT